MTLDRRERVGFGGVDLERASQLVLIWFQIIFSTLGLESLFAGFWQVTSANFVHCVPLLLTTPG